MSFGDHAHDARQQRLRTDLLGSHQQAAGAVDGGAYQAFPGMLLDWDRLAAGVVGGALGASKSAKLGIFGLSWLQGAFVVSALGAGLWAFAPPPWERSGETATPVTAAVSAFVAPVARAALPRPTRLPAQATSAASSISLDPSKAPSVREERSRPDTLRGEIELLEDVRSALERGDGGRALQRLDAHVTGDRQLLAERRAARILALSQLGRIDEARRDAASLLRDEPASLQRAAVERSCAGAKTTDER